MKKSSKLLGGIPKLISSKISIFIYLFLFFYLVIFALCSAVIPALQPYQPSDTTQLIMGNYTNVLSALGASIAAGAGVQSHSSYKKLDKRHDELQQSVKELQDALNKMQDVKQQEAQK